MTKNNGDVITVPETAKRLSKTRMTIYRWIKSGNIAWLSFGGVYFIPISEIHRVKAKSIIAKR